MEYNFCMTEPPPFDPEKMRHDIRARMLWGDKLDDIRADWTAKVAPDVELTKALKAAEEERRAHFRSRGMLDLLIGLTFMGLAGMDVWLYRAILNGEIAVRSRGAGAAFVGLVLLPCVALYFLMRGATRLARGGEEGEAASDRD